MNLHLTQISSLPFQFDALRQSGWGSASNVGVADVPGTDTLHPAANRALGRTLIRVLAWISTMRRQSRDAAELARFSDRELSDIGLNRGDIERIHDPDFAADYFAGRTGNSISRSL